MVNEIQEYPLTRRAKLSLAGILLGLGLPILYAAYLQFQGREPLMGSLMIFLFVLFVLVLLVATGSKITLTDSSLERKAVLSSDQIDFKDIKAIHYGSPWSNFHVETDDTKIFVTKDFEQHEEIIQNVVTNVKNLRDTTEITFTGEAE